MQLRRLTFLCLAGVLAALPSIVSAATFVDTNSSISVGNLQINPTAGGTVMFSTDPTFLDVKVWSMAQNSLGEYQDDSNWQNAFVDLSANAAVTWANGNGVANYSTASVGASSAVDIPPHEKMRWAYGEGRGSLGQWFEITGGTGTTNTTLSLDYAGALFGSAGDASYFKTEIIAGLELWDAMGNQLTKKVGEHVLAGGPNETKSLLIPTTTLSDTLTLSYDTWYYTYFEGDSETYGQTPEPGSLFLILPGLALLVRRHMRVSC